MTYAAAALGVFVPLAVFALLRFSGAAYIGSK